MRRPTRIPIVFAAILPLFADVSRSLGQTRDQAVTRAEVTSRLSQRAEMLLPLDVSTKITYEQRLDPEIVFSILHKSVPISETIRFAAQGNMRLMHWKTIRSTATSKLGLTYQVSETAPPEVQEEQRRAQQGLLEAAQDYARARAASGEPETEPERLVIDEETVAFDGTEVRNQSSRKNGALYHASNMTGNNQFGDRFLHAIGEHIHDPTGAEATNRLEEELSCLNVSRNEDYSFRCDTVDGRSVAVFVGRVRSESVEVEIGPSQFLSDTVWLDVDHGMALLRREMRFDDGSLFRLTEASDYREIDSKLWFPKKCEVHEFAPPAAPASIRTKEAVAKYFVVDSISLRPIAAAAFHLSFIPGTHLVEFSKEPGNESAVTYIVPADPTQLRNAADEIRRGMPFSRRKWWLMVIIGNVGFFFLLALWYSFTKKRKLS